MNLAAGRNPFSVVLGTRYGSQATKNERLLIGKAFHISAPAYFSHIISPCCVRWPPTFQPHRASGFLGHSYHLTLPHRPELHPLCLPTPISDSPIHFARSKQIITFPLSYHEITNVGPHICSPLEFELLASRNRLFTRFLVPRREPHREASNKCSENE